MSNDLTKQPRARILSTGSEITAGVYADTNAMDLSRRLRLLGFRVSGHSAAPDDEQLIEEAIRSAFGRCELLVITGGLGPTVDDLNREIIARVSGKELRRIHRAEAMMRERFALHGRTMPERNVRQAYLPEGCVPLLNHWGTAPGFVVPQTDETPMIVALPGPPREWQPMLDRALNKHILPAFPNRMEIVFSTLNLAGVPESEVNEMLMPILSSPPKGVEVGLLAQGGIIRVRVETKAESREAAEELLESTMRRCNGLLPQDSIFARGSDDASLEETVVELFRDGKKTMAVAESCTGGGVARRLTSVPGSSEVLMEGLVTYSNEAKKHYLGVTDDLLGEYGAVSQECVRQMAFGALCGGADVAVSVSGIAGPGGGTGDKPVGFVWFGLVARDGTNAAISRRFGGDREEVRMRSELQALDMLRKWILGVKVF